jgi:hypothetical protein
MGTMSRRLVPLLAVAALLPLAGCGDSGSSSSGPGADPAKGVPSDAPVYAEAVVRPDGDVGDGVNDALKKLLQTDDPGKKVAGLFDKVGAKDGIKWDDVKEWLGKRVGVFVTGVTAGKPTFGLVVDVTDAGKAKEQIGKLAAKQHDGTLSKSSYKGVALTSDSSTAYAVTGDYLLIGRTPAVKQSIDTLKGGRPMTDVADYNAARAAVKSDDALGTVYLDPQGIVDLIGKAVTPAPTDSVAPGNPFGNPQALTFLRQIFAKFGRAAGVSVHASGDAVRIDAAGIGATGSATSPAADNVAALPDDAWLALGFGDIGKTVTNVLDQFSRLSSLSGTGTRLNFGGMFQAVEQKTGIDIKRDFLSWMGDGALYARGHSLTDVGAVLTIKSKDAVKSRKAVGILANAIRKGGGEVRKATVEGYDTAIQMRISQRLPISLFVAANGERFSLGINPQALTDVLHPAKQFGDSSSYAAATKALGGEVKPVFVLDIPTVINLVEGLGAGNSAGFAKVKPYLDALGTLAAGTAHDGDVSRFALALGLR